MLFAFQLHETHPDDYMVQLLRDHSAQYAAMTPDQTQGSADLRGTAARCHADRERSWSTPKEITPQQKRIKCRTPLPGDLAYGACGIAGLLCVIFAGWTTANPTIYRAGLAFQAIVPRASRFVVTLITGGIATIAGMFPGIAMKLLDFVAIYGMILMPMGAVIFVDFWLMRRFGLQSNYAEFSRTHFNWAAGLTWFLTLGTCVFPHEVRGHRRSSLSVCQVGLSRLCSTLVLSKLYQKNIQPGAVAEAA